MARPTYSRALKATAKLLQMSLVTIDVPGLCFQGVIDATGAARVVELIESLEFELTERKSSGRRQLAPVRCIGSAI